MSKNTMLAINAIAQGTAAQVYSRLVLAAMQKQVVFMKDLSPICYGIHFTKFNEDSMAAITSVLDALIEMDAKAGRLPLAALLVSRYHGLYVPSKAFFIKANKVYDEVFTSDNWEDLVQRIYEQYEVPGWTTEYKGTDYLID